MADSGESATVHWDRPGEPVPPPKCQRCDDPLGGSPGNWYSLVTEREQCGEPFHYHEPLPQAADLDRKGTDDEQV